MLVSRVTILSWAVVMGSRGGVRERKEDDEWGVGVGRKQGLGGGQGSLSIDMCRSGFPLCV